MSPKNPVDKSRVAIDRSFGVTWTKTGRVIVLADRYCHWIYPRSRGMWTDCGKTELLTAQRSGLRAQGSRRSKAAGSQALNKICRGLAINNAPCTMHRDPRRRKKQNGWLWNPTIHGADNIPLRSICLSYFSVGATRLDPIKSRNVQGSWATSRVSRMSARRRDPINPSGCDYVSEHKSN